MATAMPANIYSPEAILGRMCVSPSSEMREVSVLTSDIEQNVFRTLGEGVIKIWSDLPQHIQQELFEAAVLAEGEAVRAQLAVFLHHNHHRTTDALKANAMTEPDSKGG